MNEIIRLIEVLLIVLIVFIIAVIVFICQPGISPFQEPTFKDNLIPIGTLVAAWTTLLVAYAAFKTIKSTKKDIITERELDLINDIINWAKSVILSFNVISNKTGFEILQRYQEVALVGEYITGISEALGNEYSQDLIKKVKIIVRPKGSLNQIIDCLGGLPEKWADEQKHRDNVQECVERVSKHAGALIKEATKVKLKIIRRK